eukprot:scaffold195790_cov14-Tisochrysis_lutea.AAC.1
MPAQIALVVIELQQRGAWLMGVAHFPGELEKVLTWFRDYKIPDGKPANKFGYDNKCMDRAFANKVSWKNEDKTGTGKVQE